MTKTHEQFVNEMNEYANNRYEYLTEYLQCKQPITIKHIECGYTWDIIPASLLAATKKGRNVCPNCNGRLAGTTETFKKKVFELVGNEYLVIGDYKSSIVPLKMKHNIKECGYEYTVRPSDFIHNTTRCAKCYGNIRKTHSQFLSEVENLYGDVYEFPEKYVNGTIPIPIIHKKCGYRWELSPSDLLHNKRTDKERCPNCNNRIEGNTEVFKQKVKKLSGYEYLVLGEYVHSSIPIRMKHNVAHCMYEFEMRPSGFTRGSRCPKCYGKPRKTTEEFKEDVYNLKGNEYEVIGEYINSTTNIKMQHLGDNCNHIFIFSFS